MFHYSTQSLDQLTSVSGVGSSPALATCETSQVLLVGVPGVFSRVSPFFVGPSHMSLNNLERDNKQNIAGEWLQLQTTIVHVPLPSKCL